MAVSSRLVPAPAAGLVRVAKDVDPFTFWPPRTPLDSTAPQYEGNRFDDPAAVFGSIYCATDAVAAFGETIARYRTCEGLLGRIDEFLEDDPDSEFDPELHPGKVPDDYFAGRYIGTALADGAARFVDLEHPDTHSAAAFPLHHVLEPFNVSGRIDRGTMHNQDRRITRTVAGYFYALAQTADHSELAGLRYESRIHGAWECWLVWEPSPFLPNPAIVKVTRTHPALIAAAKLLDITI